MKLIKVSQIIYALIVPINATNFESIYESYPGFTKIKYTINGKEKEYCPSGEGNGWENFTIIGQTFECKFFDITNEEKIIWLKYD